MLENYKNKFHCSGLHCSFMIFHCLSRLGNLAGPHHTIAFPRPATPDHDNVYDDDDDYEL